MLDGMIVGALASRRSRRPAELHAAAPNGWAIEIAGVSRRAASAAAATRAHKAAPVLLLRRSAKGGNFPGAGRVGLGACLGEFATSSGSGLCSSLGKLARCAEAQRRASADLSSSCPLSRSKGLNCSSFVLRGMDPFLAKPRGGRGRDISRALQSSTMD